MGSILVNTGGRERSDGGILGLVGGRAHGMVGCWGSGTDGGMVYWIGETVGQTDTELRGGMVGWRVDGMVGWLMSGQMVVEGLWRNGGG